ncbi:MAG TPA: L-threonylcarbamoyladenylate synthase [Chthonomonadales bacterium]|nr:L-threonylcarbamoyladenylate synthase [Chthonomonadales bacterium]
MHTEVWRVDPHTPDPTVILRAAEALRGGKLVAFPTETVYGLGANALDAGAVTRIFHAKERPPTNPLIVHIADIPSAIQLVVEWPESAEKLARQFWPGPLTLVLPKREVIPDIVTAGGKTVALRVPAHPVALALIREAGVPVAAPSANRSSHISPTRAEHVLRDLGGRIEMVLNAGPTMGGLESTVLDLTSAPACLLRPGLITPSQIEEVIGPIVLARGARDREGTALRSPGMLPRHYAPRAPLECALDSGRSRVQKLCRQGKKVGWIAFGAEDAEELPNLITVEMPTDPRAYSKRLYAVLHALDEAGVEQIVVALPPDTEEWLAVRDRLRRASSPPG